MRAHQKPPSGVCKSDFAPGSEVHKGHYSSFTCLLQCFMQESMRGGIAAKAADASRSGFACSYQHLCTLWKFSYHGLLKLSLMQKMPVCRIPIASSIRPSYTELLRWIVFGSYRAICVYVYSLYIPQAHYQLISNWKARCCSASP